MQTATSNFARALAVVTAAVGAVVLGTASAQTADPAAIAQMLRDGGYTLVMRHASAPQQAAAQGGPGPRGAGGGPRGGGPGGAAPERQLDENGRAHATAIGFAFRELDISIGEVLTSPTLRARQTADYLGYDAEPADELGPGGDNAQWMQSKAAESLEAGTNRLLITHGPNMQAAFGDAAAGMDDAETLVVAAQNGDLRVVGRLTSQDLARLAVGNDGS